jgi:hypothetical protein
LCWARVVFLNGIWSVASVCEFLMALLQKQCSF